MPRLAPVTRAVRSGEVHVPRGTRGRRAGDHADPLPVMPVVPVDHASRTHPRRRRPRPAHRLRRRAHRRARRGSPAAGSARRGADGRRRSRCAGSAPARSSLHAGGAARPRCAASRSRPWLAASIAGRPDRHRRHRWPAASGLPDGAAPATIVVAGASALISAAVAAPPVSSPARRPSPGRPRPAGLRAPRRRARRSCSCTRSAPTATRGTRCSTAWPPSASVVAVDLPGFGASRAARRLRAPDAGPRWPRRCGRACEDVVGRALHVAGNSLGGWVALELALAGAARVGHGDRPGRACGPSRSSPKRGVARSLARGLAPALPALVRTPRGRRLAARHLVARPENVPPDAALRPRRAPTPPRPGSPRSTTRCAPSASPRLERIRVPVTLAWPDHDRLVARPAHLPPRVRNVILHGCGHMPMWDDPEQVAGVVLAGSTSR